MVWLTSEVVTGAVVSVPVGVGSVTCAAGITVVELSPFDLAVEKFTPYTV